MLYGQSGCREIYLSPTFLAIVVFGLFATWARRALQRKLDEMSWAAYEPDLAPGARARVRLSYPSNWAVRTLEDSQSHEFSDPDGSISMFLAAFSKEEGSLDEFSAAKFSVQAEQFIALGPASLLEGNGWRGRVQNAIDKDATRRITLCAHAENVFVSITLYAASKDFDAKQPSCERLLRSLEFSK